MNELNIPYKFAKFVLGDGGGVYGEYDIPACVNSSSLGAAALEVTLRPGRAWSQCVTAEVYCLGLLGG